MEQWRRQVDGHMDDRRYAEAASVLEDELVHLRGHDARAARLDLARLYARFLDRRIDAAPHIRVLLGETISEHTRGQLRGELCAMGLERDAKGCSQ